MQHEVKNPVDLLDKKGRIVEQGWARRPYWRYDRKRIHAPSWRIKEWDYYAVVNQKKGYAVTATMSDLGYGAMYALSYEDYTRKACAQQSAMAFFPKRMGFVSSSAFDQDISWANKDLRFAFVNKNGKRHILFASPSLVLPDGTKGLDVDLTLVQPSELESMNIATSWEKKRTAFYLNQKVNCMEATGRIRRGYAIEEVGPKEAWGVLDWGRGVWTYQNRWYWGSASGLVDGVRFGFNLGYGFSDRSPASENVLFYDGVIHKLDEISFHIPENSFLAPWTFTSNDDRLRLSFQPCVDRSSDINALVIKSVQHQVFGYFSGDTVLDDGRIIRLDHFPGFAEDVFNRW
jgi:hypothetical protein